MPQSEMRDYWFRIAVIAAMAVLLALFLAGLAASRGRQLDRATVSAAAPLPTLMATSPTPPLAVPTTYAAQPQIVGDNSGNTTIVLNTTNIYEDNDTNVYVGFFPNKQ